MAEETKKEPAKLAGAFGLFGKSYELIKKNFELFMVLFSVSGLIALWETFARLRDEEVQGRGWSNLVTNGILGPDVTGGVLAAGGLMFIVAIVAVILYLLLVIAAVRVTQGQKPSLRQLWGEFVERWLWLKLIGGIILSGLAIVIGLILLIVPGILLIWKLFFVPYVLVDQKTSIDEAFKRSWDMTKGRFTAVYGVILVTILLSITGILPIIGSLVTFLLTSAYTLAPALRYQELKKLA